LEEELGFGSSPVHDGIITLDEIGELVQQAELLVKQSARSRGVECGVDMAVEVGSLFDDEDDETIIIKKHQNGNGDQPNKNTISASANSKCSRGSREAVGFPLRKCNGSSISVSTNNSQIKCSKSTVWTAASAISGMDIGNNNAPFRGDGENLSAVATTTSGVQKSSKKSSRVKQWVRAHNSDSFQSQKVIIIKVLCIYIVSSL